MHSPITKTILAIGFTVLLTVGLSPSWAQASKIYLPWGESNEPIPSPPYESEDKWETTCFREKTTTNIKGE